MKQEQHHLSNSRFRQQQAHPPGAGQRIFWGFFWGVGWWLLFGLVSFSAGMAYYGLHHLFFLLLHIMLAAYIALMIIAIRRYQRFRKAISPPPSQQSQAQPRADSTHLSEGAHSNPVALQPYNPDYDQFQVPYPGQE